MRAPVYLVATLVLGLLAQVDFPTQPPRMRESANPGPSITEKEVLEIVRRSTELLGIRLGEVSVRLPCNQTKMNRVQREVAQKLKAGGWLRFTSRRRIALTPKALADPRFFDRGDRIDVVQTATKQVTRVVSFDTPQRGSRRLRFEWFWLLNDIGNILPAAARPDTSIGHKASAIVSFDSREWYLVRIQAD